MGLRGLRQWPSKSPCHRRNRTRRATAGTWAEQPSLNNGAKPENRRCGAFRKERAARLQEDMAPPGPSAGSRKPHQGGRASTPPPTRVCVLGLRSRGGGTRPPFSLPGREGGGGMVVSRGFLVQGCPDPNPQNEVPGVHFLKWLKEREALTLTRHCPLAPPGISETQQSSLGSHHLSARSETLWEHHVGHLLKANKHFLR